MVEVDIANVGHLLRCAFFIEAINWDQSALFVVTDTNAFKNLVSDSRFSRCCTSCDSNKNCLRQWLLFDVHLGNIYAIRQTVVVSILSYFWAHLYHV